MTKNLGIHHPNHGPLTSLIQWHQRLPDLNSVAINGEWEALLVGRPRHEDGGGSGRPPLDAISQNNPASGGLALLRLFGFRTEETLALR